MGPVRSPTDFDDFQGEFLYRHYIESRVQSCVFGKESSRNQLKSTDVHKSSHTDLDVAQDNHRNVKVRFVGRLQKIHFVKRDISKTEICGPGGN